LRDPNQSDNNNGRKQHDCRILWNVRDRHDNGSRNCVRNGLVLSALLLLGAGNGLPVLRSVAGYIRGRVCLQPVDWRLRRWARRLWPLRCGGRRSLVQPRDRKIWTICERAGLVRWQIGGKYLQSLDWRLWGDFTRPQRIWPMGAFGRQPWR